MADSLMSRIDDESDDQAFASLRALVTEVHQLSAAVAWIRELHRPFTRDYPGGDGRTVCNHCLGPIAWPCLTAVMLDSTGSQL